VYHTVPLHTTAFSAPQPSTDLNSQAQLHSSWTARHLNRPSQIDNQQQARNILSRYPTPPPSTVTPTHTTFDYIKAPLSILVIYFQFFNQSYMIQDCSNLPRFYWPTASSDITSQVRTSQYPFGAFRKKPEEYIYKGEKKRKEIRYLLKFLIFFYKIILRLCVCIFSRFSYSFLMNERF